MHTFDDASGQTAGVSRRRPPNVLMIVADDLGWGDLSSVNGGLSETPNLDQLIAESTCLEHHYSASPVCAPARAALLTGRYPHRTGAIDTLEGRGLDRIHLREETFAGLLGDAGLRTGLIGKWHNGAYDPRFHPTARGFDEFVGFSGGWSDYFDWRIDRGGSTLVADGRHLTEVFTEEAIEFVRRHRDEPFCLTLAYNAPHYPLQAPEEDVAAFADRDDLSEGVRLVYAMVRSMDRGIGRVLDALDDLGLADDTIVLFTSDNGPQLAGVAGYDTMRFNSGLSGMKGLVDEGGIRLPMVVRWPSRLAGGRRIHELVHLTDWLPTLAEWCGAPLPNLPLDGSSAAALLDGRPHDAPAVRCWQWNRYRPDPNGNAAIRDGRWKLVRPPSWAHMFPTPDDLAADHDWKTLDPGSVAIDRSPWPPAPPAERPEPRLFDLESDPGETTDLAEVHPLMVTRLEQELDRWFAEVDDERRSLSWT